MNADPTPPGPDTPMRELLARYPGARRTLFRNHHIGGCSSCGFRDEETIAEVCARNEGLPVDRVLKELRASHEEDLRHLIEPAALKGLIDGGTAPRILDIRTREEFEAVQIPGAELFTQEGMQAAFALWPKHNPVVVYDHTGTRALDAAAFFTGHGFSAVRALRGGIDAYSEEADPSLPRYTLEPVEAVS
jgi:rhodanese-related sulfurtransferase